MKTDELLRYKALHQKAIRHNVGLMDLLDSGALKLEGGESMTRNICAQISTPLFEDVQKYCDLLAISKRQFVEMAIIDLLAKTREIVREVDPFDVDPEDIEVNPEA